MFPKSVSGTYPTTMTPDQPNPTTMTTNEQQIAIATACGWTGTEEDYTYYGFTQNIPMTRTRWTNPSGGQTTLTLPDYLNDLNAMHEAEKVLSEKQWVQYEEEIRTVVLGGIRLVSQWTKADIHATAAQKAKAFLQTLGLWQPTPTQPQ